MKILLTLHLLFLSVHVLAQNSAPSVSIGNVSLDAVEQRITVSYQLSDEQNDACNVWFKYSTDGGEYYAVAPSSELSGDVGAGISSGSRSIVWDYSAYADEIFGMRISIVASDGHPMSIADMVDQVSETELLENLEAIVGIRHFNAAPMHLEQVRTYIENKFEDAGLQTERHGFTQSGTAMNNIIGRKAGLADEAITYIVDAHFDGVSNSPGADDNGSAVAGVLEILRILSQHDFEHSIRFIGFDAEELGLIGSQRYVQNGIKPYEDIQGVLNFEMIGYYSDEPNTQQLPAGFGTLFPVAAQAITADEFRGNFLTVVGNTASNPLTTAFISASETYVPVLKNIVTEVPGTGTIAPDLRRSDHARFWDAGKQALMLTDGANFRNFNYHTPGDTIGTLNLTFMANVVKATLATVAVLAKPISVGEDNYDLSVLSVHDHGHEHSFPAELNIYPNPTDGLLTLQTISKHFFRARVEIYDLNGRQLMRKVLEIGAGSNLSQLDVSELPSGTYMMVLYASESTASLSVVVN